MHFDLSTATRTCVALCTMGFATIASGQSTIQEAQLIPRSKRVLTLEEQQALTPRQVYGLLKAGNQRFVAGTLTQRNHTKQIRDAAAGQFPKAVILSCLDSRIPVEDVFDCGIGDLFVARVAGNFSNTDILGSMEFGCKIAGAKLIFVLGHDSCGAVNAAIDGAQLGNITSMLANIRPAVDGVKYAGKRRSDNPKFARMVTEANVRMTLDSIRKNSPVLKDLEKRGKIIMVGGVYDMKQGKVSMIASPPQTRK